MYDAEVGLLVTEGAFASDGRPRPRGELRSFINRTAFTTAHLEALIRKHDLARKLGGSSSANVEPHVRRLISMETWHDYFEGYRQSSDPPRSARVTIGFTAPDPALALAVAQDLGKLVAETQAARLAEAANQRVEDLRILADAAGARAKTQRMEFERERWQESLEPTAGSRLRINNLSTAASAAQLAAHEATTRLVEAQLQMQATRQMGGLVEIVDPGLPLWQTASRARRLANQAILSAFLAGLLAVILVGAFDTTIRDEQDLRRIGIRPLGTVPSCDDASSRASVV